MGENNILSGGIDTLKEIKDNIIALQNYQSNLNSLLSEEEGLEKNITSLEEAVAAEIADTTKKRRQEIEETYDKQINLIKGKIKKIKDKRDKYKSTKVSERINGETEFLRIENDRLKSEGKSLIKEKRLPALCYSKLYFALYSPSDLIDFLIILGVLLLTMFAIPCGIYFFLLPEQITFYLILIYIVAGILFFGLYMVIGNRTKDKHPNTIKAVKEIRKSIKKNNKQIAAIRKSILKDRDESSYGLESFDEEIQKLEEEGNDIDNKKKEAMLTFDNTTSKVIAGEIRGRREAEIIEAKTKIDQCRENLKECEEKIKVLTLKIASEYEPFIGKDLMKLDCLDSLVNIIEAGNANTVSEALTFYKQNVEGENK